MVDDDPSESLGRSRATGLDTQAFIGYIPVDNDVGIGP